MQSASSKSLLVLILLILLILGGGIGFEVYAIRNENDKANALALEVERSRAGDRFVKDLEGIQTGHQAELDALDKIAVKKEDLVALFELIERTGTAMKVAAKISSVTVDANKSASTTESKVHVKIEAEGYWQESIGFVHALESLPYRITVDSVRMTSDLQAGGPADTKPRWRSDISLSFLSFK